MNTLKSLRDTLKTQKLDGFLVPRNDEHMGEYVAPCSERLAWLTGFNGSAGASIVLASKAALFVDGRYTLQAQHQVNQADFEIADLTRTQMISWLKKNAPEKAKIAFDPWLHPVDEIEALMKELHHFTFIAQESNPIDKLWKDRPAEPSAPVYLYPTHFAGKSSLDKRKDIQKILADKNVDAAVLTAPDSIAWLLNIRGGDVPHTPFALSFLIMHASGKIEWFIDQSRIDDLIQKELNHDIAILPRDSLKSQLKKLSSSTIMLDPKTVPYWFFQVADEYAIRVARSMDPVQLPKAKKNALEIENNYKAHLYDGVAMVRFLCWLDENIDSGEVTEISAAHQLLGFRKANNAFIDTSFDTISGSASNAAIIHYRVTPETNKHLRQNHIYLVDSGGQYFEGTTDITRTVFFGEPSPEIKTSYTCVLKGHIALAMAKFPKGTTGSQLDVLARQALWSYGLNYAHGTGHGVGCYLSVHEGPQRISPQPNTIPLEPGMILSNEPGYYKPGEYGIRIENLITVTDEGNDWYSFATLTICPIALNLIDIEQLTASEKLWLNSYHENVHNKLRDHLSKPEQDWLKKATQAI